MVDNSWTDGPFEDRKISVEPSWPGLPSDDKQILVAPTSFMQMGPTLNRFQWPSSAYLSHPGLCQQGYVVVLVCIFVVTGNHEYQWWKYQAVCIFERILNRSQVGGGNLPRAFLQTAGPCRPLPLRQHHHHKCQQGKIPCRQCMIQIEKVTLSYGGATVASEVLQGRSGVLHGPMRCCRGREEVTGAYWVWRYYRGIQDVGRAKEVLLGQASVLLGPTGQKPLGCFRGLLGCYRGLRSSNFLW